MELKRTGGALCNVIIDLANLIKAAVVCCRADRNDDNAKLIKEKLSEYSNINGGIKEKGETSFTAVMSSLKTSKNIFPVPWQCRDEEHFDWDKLNVDLMHIAIYCCWMPRCGG